MTSQESEKPIMVKEKEINDQEKEIEVGKEKKTKHLTLKRKGGKHDEHLIKRISLMQLHPFNMIKLSCTPSSPFLDPTYSLLSNFLTFLFIYRR